MNFIPTQTFRQKLYISFAQTINTHYLPTQVSWPFPTRSCRFSSGLSAKLLQKSQSISARQLPRTKKENSDSLESHVQKVRALLQQKTPDIHVEERNNDTANSPELNTDHIQPPRPMSLKQEMRDLHAEWKRNNMLHNYEAQNRVWDIYTYLSDKSELGGKVHLNYIDISNTLHMMNDYRTDGQFEKANKLKDDFTRLGFHIPQINHMVLVTIYCRGGHMDLAEDHFNQYKTAPGRWLPSHQNQMLKKLLRGYAASGNMDKALEYYYLIKKREATLNYPNYEYIIRRLIKFDYNIEAQGIYQDMIDLKLKPTIRIYNELLNMAMKLTDDDLFARYQADIEANGLKNEIDSYHYSVLFRAYSRGHRYDLAMRVYYDFLRSGKPLLGEHIGSYISGFLSHGDEGKAQRIFDQHVDKLEGPEVYLTFIHHYARNGRVDMVDYWLRKMERYGYPRTKLTLSLIIFNLAILSNLGHNLMGVAADYYKELEACTLTANEPIPYLLTHVEVMIQVNLMGFHAMTNRMDRCMADALKAIEQCVDGPNKNRSILISNIFDAIGYYGTLADVEKIRARIKEVGIVMNANNLNSLAEALIRVKCPEEGVNLFWDEMYTTGRVNLKTLILFRRGLKNDENFIERDKIFRAAKKDYPEIMRAFIEWERNN